MTAPQPGRRGFIAACGTLALSAALGGAGTLRAVAIEGAPRTRLVDAAGRPMTAAALEPGRNYLFFYPYVSTPCLLLRLGTPTPRDVPMKPAAGEAYSWPGGIGPDGDIVAYMAICTHALTYDTAATSLLTYGAAAGKAGGPAGAVTCCAHGSAYDPAAGAAVLAGPAPAPLMTVRLEHDAATGQLFAVGLLGNDLTDAFFAAYRGRLNAEYGRGGYRAFVAGEAGVLPLEAFSREIAHC